MVFFEDRVIVLLHEQELIQILCSYTGKKVASGSYCTVPVKTEQFRVHAVCVMHYKDSVLLAFLNLCDSV